MFLKYVCLHNTTTGTGITSRFAAVSEQINCVEQALKTDKNLPAVANLIRKLQEEEKEKLLLVRTLPHYQRMKHAQFISRLLLR